MIPDVLLGMVLVVAGATLLALLLGPRDNDDDDWSAP